MEILNGKRGGLSPHSSKIQWSTDVQIFLRATRYFRFSLELAHWNSLVSFHRSEALHCAQVVDYIWSSQWVLLIWLGLKFVWNAWSPETHLKLVGATEERETGSRDLLLSHTYVLYQLRHTSTRLGQPLGRVCRYQHQKLYGLGSRAPKCSKTF